MGGRGKHKTDPPRKFLKLINKNATNHKKDVSSWNFLLYQGPRFSEFLEKHSIPTPLHFQPVYIHGLVIAKVFGKTFQTRVHSFIQLYGETNRKSKRIWSGEKDSIFIRWLWGYLLPFFSQEFVKLRGKDKVKDSHRGWRGLKGPQLKLKKFTIKMQ